MEPMKAETSHIETCRERFDEHYKGCIKCYYAFRDGLYLAPKTQFCEPGANLYDEYQMAISSHADCEKVEL